MLIIQHAGMARRTTRQRTFLREWREARGLTQEQLGELTGYTQGMISQWESGTSGMDLEHVDELATALRITPRQLLYTDPRLGERIEDIYDALPESEQLRILAIAKTLRGIPEG